MATAELKGLDRFKALLAYLPEAIKADMKAALDKESNDLVEALKRACPVAPEFEAHPGQLRDSIHAYDNPHRPMSRFIVADAKDEKGHKFASHVEFGHIDARYGKQVPPSPFFFPIYRARRAAMKRRLSAAYRRAVDNYLKGKI